MSQATTTTPITPRPTSVREPRKLYGREQRSYVTRWEIDESHGAELVVIRREDRTYGASFRAVTFERHATGVVSVVRHTPAGAVKWTIEATARYSAKRLREINEQTTASLAQRLTAGSPAHAEALARATRAGALGAMNAAAAHLRATFPDLDETRCATEAVAGWTCLSITYPSGNPRTHALHDDEANCWDVSCYPDVQNDPPYYEQAGVADADLADVVQAHHRRTF